MHMTGEARRFMPIDTTPGRLAQRQLVLICMHLCREVRPRRMKRVSHFENALKLVSIVEGWQSRDV